MTEVRQIAKLGYAALTSRSTRAFYDRISAFYDSVFEDHLARAGTIGSILSDECSRPAPAAVLDLACGTGSLTRRVQEHGYNAIGLDISLESLRRLQQRARAVPPVQADAAALPFRAASFDVVTCLGAWRHFPDSQRVVAEARRVLRPDGIFLVGYFPPKLGGLIRVPNGTWGKTLVLLYGWIVRLLNYTDRVDEATERDALQMLNLAFASVRRIAFGEDSYLLLATSR